MAMPMGEPCGVVEGSYLDPTVWWRSASFMRGRNAYDLHSPNDSHARMHTAYVSNYSRVEYFASHM